jgi:hypothetical protein
MFKPEQFRSDGEGGVYDEFSKGEGVAASKIAGHNNSDSPGAGVDPEFIKGKAGYSNYKKYGIQRLSNAFNENRFGPKTFDSSTTKFKKEGYIDESTFQDFEASKEKLWNPSAGDPPRIDGSKYFSSGKMFSWDSLKALGNKLVKEQQNKTNDGSLTNLVSIFDIDNNVNHTMSNGTNKTWGQFYTPDRVFAARRMGQSNFGEDVVEALEASFFGVFGALSLVGKSIDSFGSLENPYINFFNGIAREYNRTGGVKILKWVLNNLLLTAMNPNVRNIDEETSGGGLASALAAIGLEDNSSFAKRSVADITLRAGPSVLSWIPSPAAFAPGKGKIFNPLRISSGAGFLMGETWLPVVQVPYLDSLLDDGTLSFTEFRDDLEPKLSIVIEENPVHTKAKRMVVKHVAKNETSVSNLSSIIYGNNIGGKDVLLNNKENQFIIKNKIERIPLETVVKVENLLEAEYCPFYFHDLRTNEVISFHAFLTNLGQSFSPSWSAESFYGRSDVVPNLAGTGRTLALSFIVAAMSPKDMDYMYDKINKLVTFVYHQYNAGEKNIKDQTIPFSQLPIADPIIRLRVGDYITTNYSYKDAERIVGKQGDDDTKLQRVHANFKNYGGKGLAGYITSLDFDITNVTWETAPGYVMPQYLAVTVAFTAIHDIQPGLDFDGFNRAPLFRKNMIGWPTDSNYEASTDTLDELLKKGS